MDIFGNSNRRHRRYKEDIWWRQKTITQINGIRIWVDWIPFPRVSSWVFVVGVTNGEEHESSNVSFPYVLCWDVMRRDWISVKEWLSRWTEGEWFWFSSWLGVS